MNTHVESSLQAGAEKKVSFDWGPDGSKAEDCFFGIVALDQGYSFDFIQVQQLPVEIQIQSHA